MNPLPARLLVVTDRHQTARPLPETVADLLRLGAGWIWLRDRDLPPAERQALAQRLRRLTHQAQAQLSIGADAALAAAIGADGLHCARAEEVPAARRQLGPGSLIGVSAHSRAEVAAARQAGADYVTLSPIFASASKPGYGPALGLKAIEAAAGLQIPILALGGITAENAPSCIAAGATGVAMMGPPMRLELPAALLRIEDAELNAR